MELSDIAKTIFDRVVDYCTNNYDNPHNTYVFSDPLGCMEYYAPNILEAFLDNFLTNEDNDIIETKKNSGWEFWDMVKSEYTKLWRKWMDEELAYKLGHTLESEAQRIMKDNELDDSSKVRYLTEYAEVLNKFADTIKQALQNGEPESVNLYDWYKMLADVIPPSFNSDYRELLYNVLYPYFDYYYYYGVFDYGAGDTGHTDLLQILSLLLDYINRTLYNIENKYLPELEALTNNS